MCFVGCSRGSEIMRCGSTWLWHGWSLAGSSNSLTNPVQIQFPHTPQVFSQRWVGGSTHRYVAKFLFVNFGSPLDFPGPEWRVLPPIRGPRWAKIETGVHPKGVFEFPGQLFSNGSVRTVGLFLVVCIFPHIHIFHLYICIFRAQYIYRAQQMLFLPCALSLSNKRQHQNEDFNMNNRNSA